MKRQNWTKELDQVIEANWSYDDFDKKLKALIQKLLEVEYRRGEEEVVDKLLNCIEPGRYGNYEKVLKIQQKSCL